MYVSRYVCTCAYANKYNAQSVTFPQHKIIALCCAFWKNQGLISRLNNRQQLNENQIIDNRSISAKVFISIHYSSTCLLYYQHSCTPHHILWSKILLLLTLSCSLYPWERKYEMCVCRKKTSLFIKYWKREEKFLLKYFFLLLLISMTCAGEKFVIHFHDDEKL
jgi:hypothetical protein